MTLSHRSLRVLCAIGVGLGLSLGASHGVQAATTTVITFDTLYNENAGQCFPVGSQSGISYSNPGTCGNMDHAVLPGGKTDFPGLVLSTTASADRFDLLGLEIVNSLPEVLGVPKALLPPGIDPTTPTGYAYIWANDLWSLIAVDNLHMRGLRDGQVVAEASYFIPDTCGPGGCTPVTLPNGDAPLAGVFEEIDRLEISVVPGFGPATDFGILGDDSFWYTCLDSCGNLVIDNVALRITPADPVDPPPAPIPLPASGLLLLGAFGGLGLLRRSRWAR